MATVKRPASTIDNLAFAKANEQGQKLLARGPLATSARYVAGQTRCIRVTLNNGCAFEFPIAHAEALANAKVADLRLVEISAAGLGLYWPTLDADLYVPNLVKGVLGTKRWMAEIGANGGKASTQAKSAAARANGKLGGRPRTLQPS